jgi:MFS family permease
VSPTFRALDSRNYRLWLSGAIVSNIGTWMQRVAQDWLVLTILTHHSAQAVGITTGLQFLPMLLLAPYGGLIADRLPKRLLLMATQLTMGLLALSLGLLVVTGVAQLWMVFGFALLLGVATALDNPARQIFVSEMVPREHLANAVGLNSATFNAARLVGPGIAGLLIAWVGTGPVFLINAASFGAVLLSLWRMRTRELRITPATVRAKGQLREGFRYVLARPDIMLILVIVFAVGTFGMNFQMTTAFISTSTFHKGPGEYGILGSIMAIGSLAGALLSARREHPRLRHVVGAAFAFGVFATINSQMPTYPLFAITLIPVGLSALTMMTSANATIQMSVEPALRGRVMALYMAIFMGGTPFGAPIVGWVGETFGARWSILLGGLVTIATSLGAMVWLVRTRHLRLRYEHREQHHGEPHGVPHLRLQAAQHDGAVSRS